MERNFFLDNLRSLMVIAVVIFHSALSYTTEIVPWWYVVDKNDDQLFDLLILFLDYFQLPILFLLAGFFSISSLQKHGTSKFIINKVKKLAIPLILLSIIYIPVVPFIRYTLRAENPVGYLAYLKGYLSTISDCGIILLNKTTSIQQVNSFTVSHLWFISALFIFFCIIGTTHKFFKIKEKSSTKVIKPYLPAFIIGGFAIALVISMINLAFFDWEWIKAGSFLMFAPTRLPLYLGMFVFGVYGFKNNWFINDIPGKPWKWYFISVFISICLLACSKYMWDYRENFIGITMIHGFFRSFAAISWFCFFLNFSKKYLNKTNKILTFINKHSYETYLLHLPIVIILQLAFLKSSLNLGVKFILISVLSITLSLAFSSIIYKRVQNFIETFSFSKSNKELCESH